MGSLRAPRSVAVRSLQLLALALPRFFWARRPAPAFASPRTFSPWRQPLCSRVLAASCNVGQHRRCDQDLEVIIVACGLPWRLLISSRGSSRAQVVVSGHRRVTSMELHTCTSAALWASVGGRNDCRHGLACDSHGEPRLTPAPASGAVLCAGETCTCCHVSVRSLMTTVCPRVICASPVQP